MNKYTPENIKMLGSDEIFVFGSNINGWHGSGAAKDAIEKFGAIYGKGVGPQGLCYAIPTKDMRTQRPLALEIIELYVKDFLEYAYFYSDINFLVTKIGCGLAGFKIEDIAPMFYFFSENVILPKEFVVEIDRIIDEEDKKGVNHENI